MPPPALANLLWLGREHLLCKKASLGTRMLSCLGRPVWRKLILGKGEAEDSEKGITGNFIFLAQARLPDIGASLPPGRRNYRNPLLCFSQKGSVM
jgi:hypothetical protein